MKNSRLPSPSSPYLPLANYLFSLKEYPKGREGKEKKKKKKKKNSIYIHYSIALLHHYGGNIGNQPPSHPLPPLDMLTNGLKRYDENRAEMYALRTNKRRLKITTYV
jgi:hypothetical protein